MKATTYEKKIQAAKEKRAALISAKAELETQQAEESRESRVDELAELLEATLPKVDRINELKARLIELLNESDQVMAQDVYPAWITAQAAVGKSKVALVHRQDSMFG